MTRLSIAIILVLFMAGVMFMIMTRPKSGSVQVKEQATTSSSRVVRAARDITKGEQFDRDSVEEAFVKDVAGTSLKEVNGEFPYTSALVLGNRASRDISKGHLLTNDDITLTDEDMR